MTSAGWTLRRISGPVGAAAVVLVATLAAMPAAAASPSHPSAAKTPAVLADALTVAVNPSTGLVDGQYVTISTNAVAPIFGMALCEVGASPTAPNGECGSATANGLFGGDSAIAVPVNIASTGARKGYSTAAAPEQPAGTQTVIQLDAAFRDPSGTLIDCRQQPGSQCDLVLIVPNSAYTGTVDGPRATLSYNRDAPLRPPMAMSVSPTDSLQANQSLGVTFSNVKSTGLVVLQCAQVATTAADASDDCTYSSTPPLTGPVSVQPDAFGNATAQLPAQALIETSNGLVDCRPRTGAQACVVESGDQLTGPLTQPLTFAPNASLGLLAPLVTYRPGWYPAPSNGWTFMVDLAGFTPNSTVTFTWCSQGACDPSPIATATTQADGISSGTKLPSPLPAPSAALGCAPTNPCNLVVDDGHGTKTSVGNTTNTGQRPQTFLSDNLPVTITPASNLADGQQVMVSGQGFPPNADLAMAECSQDAATHGIDACDLTTSTIGQGARSDASGALAPTPFTVRKVITVGGEKVDCSTGNVDPNEYRLLYQAGDPNGLLGQPGYTTCLVGVAAINGSYSQSGAMPIAFAGETFKPFPGDTTPGQLSATPLAAPCDRVAGTPRDVRLAYLRLAGRCPSPQELAWWDTFVRGGGNLAGAVTGMALSPDALAPLIADVYQQLLQRAPDPGGAAYWTSALAASGRRDIFVATLLSSAEYLIALPQHTPEAWVSSVYTNVLHRSAGAPEIAYWVGRLQAGEAPGDVALAIIDSPESGALRIDQVYLRMLHRHADPAGVSYWLGALNPNVQTFTLLGALGASGEFDAAAQAQPAN